jgi:ribosomal protein S21
MSYPLYDVEEVSLTRKIAGCALGFASGVCATLAVASLLPSTSVNSSLWTSSATNSMTTGSVAAGSYVGGANRMDVMNKKDTYNVRVDVGDTEAPEAALRRFTRQWKQSGVLDEVRKRRTFEDKQDIKKRKIRERGLHKIKDRYPPMTMAQHLEQRKVINFRAGRPMEDPM